MSDSSEIDQAVIAKLLNDATLNALMPDGIWWDVAKKDATRFVIVSLSASLDEPMFQARAYEGPLYLVKAVALNTTGADVKAAAARIDTLLEGGTLTIPGYSLMAIRREERLRITEVDANSDQRWQHRGGFYSVWASA
jgi:hypothetical protein